ncbi:hypothetical protein BI372_02795 [Acinetobacter pittii]|nr:hypothetical protein BI372_02795 [Acinetobacter pittii]
MKKPMKVYFLFKNKNLQQYLSIFLKQFLYDKKTIKTISGKVLRVIIFRCVVCEPKIAGMYRLPIHLIDLTDSKDSAWPKEILTIVFLREKSISGNSSLEIKNKTQV